MSLSLHSRRFYTVFQIITLAAACSSSSDKPIPQAGDAGSQSDARAGDASVRAATDATVTDAASDAGRGDIVFRDSDASIALAPGDCPDPVSGLLINDVASWRVLVAATDIAPGASLVTFNRSAVVAKKASGEFVVAQVSGSYDQPPVQRWSAPSASTTIVAAVDSTSATETVWALACDGPCRLLRGKANEATLTASTLPDIPVTEPRGLVHASTAFGGVPCVFGRGLACAVGGSWQTSLADSTLVAVDLSSAAVAVDSEGKVWIAPHDDATDTFKGFELAGQVEGEVRSISPAGQSVVIVAGGKLSFFGAGSRDACAGAPPLQAAFPAYDNGCPIALGEDNGLLIRKEGTDSWCAWARIQPDGPILQRGGALCGLSTNPRVLTASQLIGLNECIIPD